MAGLVAREPCDDIQIGILSLRDDSRFVLIGRAGAAAKCVTRSVPGRLAQSCLTKHKMTRPCPPRANTFPRLSGRPGRNCIYSLDH